MENENKEVHTNKEFSEAIKNAKPNATIVFDEATSLVEAPKKKRGRPVGWRGTYKKRGKSLNSS